MEALLSYQKSEGVITSSGGQRSLIAELKAEYKPLGLKPGDFVAANVDAPLKAGLHVLVEYQGRLYLTDIFRTGVDLVFDLAGWRWTPRRASWGGPWPVVVGPIEASGRAL